MPITRFLPAGRAFAPQVVEGMRAAYIQALSAAGFCDHAPEAVQEILAVRIVKAAIEGEHEPERLCAVALASVGLKR